jgi:hypothetical protein
MKSRENFNAFLQTLVRWRNFMKFFPWNYVKVVFNASLALISETTALNAFLFLHWYILMPLWLYPHTRTLMPIFLWLYLYRYIPTPVPSHLCSYDPGLRNGIIIWLLSQILEFRSFAWALLLYVIDDQANNLRATPLMDYCFANAYRLSRILIELNSLLWIGNHERLETET